MPGMCAPITHNVSANQVSYDSWGLPAQPNLFPANSSMQPFGAEPQKRMEKGPSPGSSHMPKTSFFVSQLKIPCDVL